MRLAAAVVCLSVTAAPALAENNCGAMVRTMSRFRGTIRSVRILHEGETLPNDVDLDSKFAVVLELPKGETVTFAIHSPSRTFDGGRLEGRTFDLEAERMDCNGAFRRYISLRRHLSVTLIEPFQGTLEVGHTYRAKTYGTGDDLSLSGQLDLPMHHEGGINFTNADEFFANRPRNVHELVFEVVSRSITQQGERAWLTMFDVKIVSAK